MAPPPIHKGVSSPIDPGAPSLLTSVPPEVRNMIYSVLFSRETVLVHNSKAYHAEEPDRANYGSTTDFFHDLDIFHGIYEAEVGIDAEFHDELSLSLPFLRTCRQIYHEGAGVLYGCNTFVMTRALDRHDYDADGLHNDGDETQYSQLSYAPLWLSCLGSQAALLRNVLIDVDALCLLDCEDSYDYIDILPMMKFLWFHAHKDCSLLFAHTKRKLSVHESAATTSSTSTCVKSSAYNNMLQRVVVGDVLRLKCFARSERILLGVVVSMKEGDGFIRYCRTPDRTTTECSRVFSDRLERLSEDMLHRIIEITADISSTRKEIVFDLDRHTVRGLPMNILHVNNHIRYQNESPSIIGTINSVTLRVESVNIITNFGNFTTLEDLMPSGRGQTTPFRAILLQSSYSKHLTIALQLKPDVPAILDEVRIDIKGLVALSCLQALGKQASVCITLWHSNAAGANSSKTVAFDDLLKRVFLVLSDMMIQWPLEFPAQTQELPHISIDGHGNILHATYPTESASELFRVDNRHAHLRPEQVEIAGYRMTEALGYNYRNRLGKNPVEPPKSFYGVWKGLRDMYWGDYKKRRPGLF